MDPNATLKRIREIVLADMEGVADSEEYEELADLVGDLDAWMTKGGYPPAAWDPALP